MRVTIDGRRARGIGAALACLLWLPSVGCANKAGSTAAPEQDYAREKSGGDPLAELAALEQRMDALGLPVAKQTRTVGAEAAGEAAAGPAGGGDAMDDLAAADEAELAEEEAPAPEAAPADADGAYRPSRRDERDRCEDLCGLSESICELEVRICELSESHAGEPVYADACERAIDDCEVAGDACDTCHAPA
jgi:hypothetical protein